jgi:hypothetical protein
MTTLNLGLLAFFLSPIIAQICVMKGILVKQSKQNYPVTWHFLGRSCVQLSRGVPAGGRGEDLLPGQRQVVR